MILWTLGFLLGCLFCPLAEAGVPYLARSATGTFQPMQWNQTNLELLVNPSTAASLSNAEVMNEMQAAVTTWNDVADSSVNLSLVQTSFTPVSTGTPDRFNHVSFSSGGNLNPGIIGLTLTTANTQTGEIVDADILFNKGSFVFISGPSDVSANRISLQGVATHEIGHLLGFDHSAIRTRVLKSRTIPEATMFPYYSDEQKTLSQDDISILASTYPSSSNRYNGTVTGRVLSGEFASDALNGAHITLWNVLDRSMAISSISGLDFNGIRYDGSFEIRGVPQGNYEAFIEPFPMQVPNYTDRQVQLEDDFSFLERLSSTERQTWLLKNRNFPLEFWHDSEESALETTDGADNAATFAMNPGGSQTLQFVTNFGGSNVELSGSTLQLDKDILYANGNSGGADQDISWTLGHFTARDSSGFPVSENLASRLQVRVAAAPLSQYIQSGIPSQQFTRCATVPLTSLSRTSLVTMQSPTFLNEDPIRYRFELYSPALPPGLFRCLHTIGVYLDQNTSAEQIRSTLLSLEKAQPGPSEVELIPDIRFGIKTTGSDIFGYAPSSYAAPASVRIQPRFSDGSSIPKAFNLSSTASFLHFVADRPATVSTTPLTYEEATETSLLTTAVFPGRANVNLVPTLDGVTLDSRSVRFIAASTSGSRFFLSQDRVHIGLPNITTPTLNIDLYPGFEDQSPIPFELNPALDMRLRILSEESLQSVTGVTITTVQGPLILMSDGELDPFPSPRQSAAITYFGSPFYRFSVAAGPNATRAIVAAELLNSNLQQRSSIRFSYADPFETEIRALKQYLTLGSGDSVRIDVLPRFQDGTPVNADIAELIRLNLSSTTNCHGVNAALSNANGDSTTQSISIIPNSQSNGETIIQTALLTALPQAGISTNCTLLVRGRIQSNGFRDIENSAVIQLVDLSSDRIRVEVDNPRLPADGNSQTTITVIPVFPDGSSMGEGLDASRIRVSATEGTLLRDGTAMGSQSVPMLNLGDGRYQLSLRSTNFTTTSLVTIEVDNQLSLQSREIQFFGTGSADPQKTEIRVADPVLHANGQTQTRILIRPRNTFGELLFLPPQSVLSIETSAGVLAGPVTSSSDGTYIQMFESVANQTDTTARIRVFIDSKEMRPSEEFTVTMLNFDASTRTQDASYPNSAQIDAYDITLMAQAIRNRLCTEFEQTDCRLDLNLDGQVDESDMQLMLKAYGQINP